MNQQELIESHIPLALSIAKKLKKKFPFWVEMDDLVSMAYLGLVEAAERFDPELGNAFATYASFKIRGSIIDSLKGRSYPVRMLHIDPFGGISHTRSTGDQGNPGPNLLRKLSSEDAGIKNFESLKSEQAYYSRIAEVLRGHPESETLIYVFLLRLDGKTLKQIGMVWGKSPMWAHIRLKECRAVLEQHVGRSTTN